MVVLLQASDCNTDHSPLSTLYMKLQLLTLIALVSAAPNYGQGSFPWCKKWVEKPAWGGDGKPYGWENGQSCLARHGKYGKKQHRPQPHHYATQPDLHAKYTCAKDGKYFQSNGSPTLKQCAAIACAPGQSHAYVQRALYQCYALEKQAKATDGGKLPQGW